MLDRLAPYFQSMFFKPRTTPPVYPADFALSGEAVVFESGPGEVHGVFYKPSGVPRGTIVHCHGNSGNMASHVSAAEFLVGAGFQVLMFDYAGYGASPGRPTAAGIVRDAMAALAYVKARPDVDTRRIGLFGQSLGGLAACTAMARDGEVRALALEGTFTTMREMALTTWMGRLLFFLTPLVIPDVGPLRDLPGVHPRPVLILHSDADEIIPFRLGRRLFEAAQHPKEFVRLEGTAHLEETGSGTLHDTAIAQFFVRTLARG